MNSTLFTGTIVVTIALIAYSLFVFTKPKTGIITQKVVTLLTIGILLDITATILMIIGSQKTYITPHGIVGYSALAAMLIETFFIWKHWLGFKDTKPVSPALKKYTWFAYGWWVLAFVIGGMLAASSVG